MNPEERLGLGPKELVALVAGLMSLNALAIDIILPALSDLGAELAVSDPNDRQYVVIAYVLGMGAAQLFFGPASDRFGRRRPLLASLAGYSVLGLVCIWADSFAILVAARALQGVAAAGARVISLSIVRDVHAGSGMARVVSLAMMVFMAVPMLAPNLGQLVLLVAPWRWIFVVLVVFGGGMTLWVGLRLGETLPPEQRRPLQPRALANAYALVFRTRATFGYLIASGVVFGALFSYIASSEQLYDAFGRKSTFTLFFATVAGAMAVASYLNARLVERFGMRRLSHAALLAFVGVNLALVLLLPAGAGGFWVFHSCMMASFFCMSFLGANFNAIAMEPLGHVAGTASAALGFAGTLIAGVLGAAVGQQFDGTARPIAVGFLALGAVALVAVLVTERGRLLQDDVPVDGLEPGR
jgi:DHA1 family bicyclomycin/chloramphenicol resistance-like MFS transporter